MKIYDVVILLSRYRLCADIPSIINHFVKHGMRVAVVPYPDPVDLQWGPDGFDYMVKLCACQGANIEPQDVDLTCKSLFITTREAAFVDQLGDTIAKHITFDKSFYMQPILNPDSNFGSVGWLKNYTFLVRSVAMYEFLHGPIESPYEEVGIPAIDNPIFSLRIKYLVGMPSLTSVQKSWSAPEGKLVVDNLNRFIGQVDDVVVIKDINCLRMARKLEFFNADTLIHKKHRDKVIMLQDVVGLGALLGIENFVPLADHIVSGRSTTLWYGAYCRKPVMNIQSGEFRFPGKIHELYDRIPRFNGKVEFHDAEFPGERYRPGACERIAELVS